MKNRFIIITQYTLQFNFYKMSSLDKDYVYGYMWIGYEELIPKTYYVEFFDKITQESIHKAWIDSTKIIVPRIVERGPVAGKTCWYEIDPIANTVTDLSYPKTVWKFVKISRNS